MDAAQTDGRTDSEVQTGDVPDSNYASVSHCLCLYFFFLSLFWLTLHTRLSLQSDSTIYPCEQHRANINAVHNPVSFPAQTHAYTHRDVVVTAHNSVRFDPDTGKHKTLYLKDVSRFYSNTCQLMLL